MVLRDEVHSVSVVFDALLPIFGEIPQHLQRLHADGDVILVCPDLQSNEHHTRVQLLFEDLPLKQREFLIVETERCSIATTGRQGLLNTLITQSYPLHTSNIHLATIVCMGKTKWYKWKKILEIQALNHYLQYSAVRKYLDLFANTKLNIEQIQLLVFRNSLALQEVSSECFDYEMCSLKTMNELNHVAAQLHSWTWSTAAATGRNHRRSSRCLQSAHTWYGNILYNWIKLLV